MPRLPGVVALIVLLDLLFIISLGCSDASLRTAQAELSYTDSCLQTGTVSLPQQFYDFLVYLRFLFREHLNALVHCNSVELR